MNAIPQDGSKNDPTDRRGPDRPPGSTADSSADGSADGLTSGSAGDSTGSSDPWHITLDDPRTDDITELLQQHLAQMHALSPPDSVHALDAHALLEPSVTLWSLRERGILLGICAVKQLNREHGELKSMRTTDSARRRGVANRLLAHVLDEARTRGFTRLSLETGSAPAFAAARRLYERAGFVYNGPFADYEEDPHSVFMTLALTA